MNALQQAAKRFPLIARPRPVCLPLSVRVSELRELSDTAAHCTTGRHLTLAAETLNKAALIASDCGASAMARSMCWRHFAAHRPGWPLEASRARLALEQLVNLARLAIRDNEGVRGRLLLHDLLHAVSNGGVAEIDGHHVMFEGLTRTDDDLRSIRTWLWGVFLAEGIRALISADHWNQAVAHAQQYRGVGRRLLDGRQATIVARCLAGDPDAALKLVTDSAPEEPWEHAVAACLDALCRQAAGRSTGNAVTEAQRRYCTLDRTPGLLVFRARLALTILDVGADREERVADRVFAALIADIRTTVDGYTAREVLTHNRGSTLLSDVERDDLTAAVRNAGLGLGTIPEPLLSDLLTAVQTSETTIETACR